MPITDSKDVNTITITDAKNGDVITCRADNNVGYDEIITGNFATYIIQNITLYTII